MFHTPACTILYLEEALVLFLAPRLLSRVLGLADAMGEVLLSLSRSGVLLALVPRTRADHDRDVFERPTEPLHSLHQRECAQKRRTCVRRCSGGLMEWSGAGISLPLMLHHVFATSDVCVAFTRKRQPGGAGHSLWRQTVYQNLQQGKTYQS